MIVVSLRPELTQIAHDHGRGAGPAAVLHTEPAALAGSA
jgi:hypothetical protein